MSLTKAEKLPINWRERLNWYLTIFVLALTIIIPLLLCGLFYLSQVPDITWTRDDGLTIDRIWMYHERRPLGIGYQGQRVIFEYSPTEVCVQTRLRFLLWGSSRLAQPATAGQKMILVNNHWQATGEKCGL
jgi:hypothetical protein